MNPVERLRIISKFGAKRIPINYVQPALKPGQGRSYLLNLITFPIDNESIQFISSNKIRMFLEDFYKAQGIKNLDNDIDFQNMMSQLRSEMIYLEPLNIIS